ncbi:protein S100-B-like [Colossoma macropomum]|uniref:protein S100-B-like n=1 Tax=Colossoma macropomum TaxID=42526 RepID=UPI001864F2CD|nr:protein S100-B-like [Colossoma macropomum]
MSKLEKAIVSIVEVFEEYAGTDDKKRELSGAELSELLKSQLSSPDFKDKIDKDDITEALDKIDKNHDGQVNFREFSQCVALLARGYFRKKHGKGKGKDKGNQ